MSANPIVSLIEQRKAYSTGGAQINSVETLLRSAGLPALNNPPLLDIKPKRNTAAYNKAQANEKPAFQVLLYELCKTIEERWSKAIGRPRIPSKDAVYLSVYKTYTGISSRRFVSDVKDLHSKGYISFPAGYASISRFFCNEALTPLLNTLIAGVAASFSHIETQFAIDSSGFRIPKINRWYDEKYGWRKRREWLKVHVMVGVRSHIITAVQVTKRSVGDPKCFASLSNTTSEAFSINEIAADGAYSTVGNLEYSESIGAFPAIPFKSNANPFRHAEDSAWRRLFHYFALNQEDFREKVNRQSHVECAFSMIKGKFGERIFNKTETGQINEALCKILCHNLCVLIYWLYEFGVNLEN